MFLKIIQNNGCLNKILAFCQDQNEEIELSPVNAAAARALAKSARKRMSLYSILYQNNQETTNFSIIK